MPNNSEGIKTKVSVQGDKQYKDSLAQISRQLTVLNTDMKASQTAFGAQAETMDGLHDRLEKLNEIYEVQANKVDLIREKLEKAKASEDTSQKTIDELTIALNRATAQMNDTGNKINQTKGDMDRLADAQEALGDRVDAGSLTLKEAEQAMKDMATETAEAAKASKEAGDSMEDTGSKSENAAGGVGDFAKALGDAASAVGGGFLDGVQGLLGALGSIGSACVEALGEAFDLAKGAGKYADDLMTLSSQVGVDTDKLQQWQYSSNFIDTSVDTITGSLTKLTKKMASAQEEEKDNAEKWQEHLAKIAKGEKDTWSEATTARDAFIKLGVSWKDYNGNLRDNEEVFMDLIDALGKVENPVERDALAMDLFGKSAKELNPLIEAGSQAWREMGQEAEAMGTVFSKENLDKMGSFDDSMQRMNATGEALANSIGLTVIPAFQPLVDAAAGAMGEVAKALQNGASPEEIETLLDGVLDSFSEALQGVGQLIEDSLPVITEVVERVLGTLSDALPGLMKALLPGVIALVDGLGDAIAENAEAIGELAAAVMTAIGTALVTALPKIIEKLPEIFKGIYEGLTGSDFEWSGLGGEILGRIVEGLSGFGEKVKEIFTGGRDEAIKVDWEGVKDDLKDVGAQLLNLAPKALSAGLEGAYGIIEGLNWSALGETIGHIASGLLGLAGEAIAAPLQTGYGLIKDINWLGLGETMSAVPNGLLDLTGDMLAQAFQNGHDIIEKINWSGLTDALAAVPNALINAAGVGGELLSAPFEMAYGIIDDIQWDELGNEIADGLGRAWGIVSGVGDVALGLGEAAVGAGQQGVGALKDWIASWRDDGEVETEATAVGAQVITDVGTGVTGEVPQLETTAQEAADALLEAIKGQLTETVVKQIGLDVDANIGKGIEEGKPGEDGLIVIVEALASDAYKALSDAVTIQDFKTIGKAMDEGIAQGITNHSGLIETAAWNAAQAAYDSARLALDINSPSKKGGWLGEMFDLGFAGGLIDNADEIESAMAFLNDVTAAEAEPVVVGGASAQGGSGFVLDYDRVRDAFVEAIEETGVGNMVMQMDKEIVGETLEPVTSRATRQRQQRSVKGRTARLVIG